MHASPIASVSVDLDGLDCYYRIHGLGEPPAGARHLVLRRALNRFAELFDACGRRATFFVIGRDLELDVEGRALLRRLARDGHELANHSYSHPYALGRLPEVEIENEIQRAHEVIAETAEGVAPVGFRAPGYQVSGRLLAALGRVGYRYDSSVLPSPPYFLLKTAVMGAMAAIGRPSGSSLTDPRALFAPARPYWPRADRWYGGRCAGRPGPEWAATGRPPEPLSSASQTRPAMPLELPLTVLPGIAVPLIGTTLVLARPAVCRGLVRLVRGQAFVNLELHGIDLADAADDAIPGELVRRRPDLRRPLSARRAALAETLSSLRTHFELLPLREVARRLGA